MTEILEGTPVLDQPVQQQQVNLKVGYVVGVKEDGKLMFDLAGSQAGLIELLGLHFYAGEQLKKLYGNKQMTGDAITIELANMIDKLGKMVETLDSKVAEINRKLDLVPVRPL